ncbi:TerB family tellurite resistance protein [Pseudomonas sp. RC10]|uniref:TerB family tellurite resistance protein n=1 Tax=Pseudomonas bambusae TaxID=3139142 RepID=UPI003138A5CB
MLWPFTLIGGGAGYAIASIPGAMLGALLGQALDRRLHVQSLAELRERLAGRKVPRDDELIFILLGRVAKTDGRVVDGHIQQARVEMRRLDLSEPATRRAIAAFNRGKDGRDNLRVHLMRLKNQPHAAEGLLRACWRMAWADGRASRGERELIVSWGKWLGWTAEKVEALSATEDEQRSRSPASSGGEYQEALRLLGVRSDAEPAQIKRAYRRLLSRHHPDKVAGSGASPVQVRDATEKTRDLHHAYAVVRERRGFR